MLTVLIKNINTYGAQHQKKLKTIWQDTLVIELKAFLNILIYRSLYPHPKHKDFWNLNPLKPVHTGLTNTLSRDHFTQLKANLHISDPDIKGDIFSKLKPINTMLLDICKVLWQPSSSLAMDECMSRFTGYTKEKITIPTKPIPTGIKG